jgi:hypothetical protein
MILGIVGKPNAGKSTFLSAATLSNVEIADYPFTTIKPNQAIGFVRVKCPHLELGIECNPVNSKCFNGERFVPVSLIDVAGLVPEAHKGKGLGNQFLSDLMQADALIHVVDASGSTDLEGKPVSKNSHNPVEDIIFLEKELNYWIKGILTKNWVKISKQAGNDFALTVKLLAKQLSGLKISEDNVKNVLIEGGFQKKLVDWSEEELLRFSEMIRKKSKPILIAANKVDIEGSEKNVEVLKKSFPDYKIVSCSAESELALRKAVKSEIISYLPGNNYFEFKRKDLPEKQLKALEFIKKNVLEKFNGTGIQKAINSTVFELLDMIVVFPVQDSHKWVSGKGNVLPDAFLLKKGSTAIDLAVKIHSEFGKKFLGAIDCRTQKKIGREHELKNGDVVKILLST